MAFLSVMEKKKSEKQREAVTNSLLIKFKQIMSQELKENEND